MEISINEWFGGLNQDLSREKLQPNQYRSASNFRILTDKGSSSLSLENVKGNVFNIQIPDTGPVQKISIGAIGDVFQTISINASGAVVFDTTNKAPKDLYTFISTNSAFNSGYGIEYNVYYNSNSVYIVPIGANTVTILLIGSGLTIDANYIPAQQYLEVIGNTQINDDIYILTTNCTDKEPGVLSPASYGQIWKITIDDVTNTSTIDLIYNNAVNFTTYHAIAPTAILGRYENGSIKRIYWTDFFNKIRQLNVADPQAFAIDLSLLELVPAIDFDIPILTEIHEGGTATLKVGAYQMAYRFKNTTGSTTQFSPLSNIVYVVNHKESIGTIATEDFYDYIGDTVGTDTTKIISWTLNNIDPDFDRIESVVLVREKTSEVPTIYSFNEQSINNRTSITITCSGDILKSADTVTLSLSEFLSLSGFFTHCKTLTTKDNRLVVGNIKNASLDLNYDARTYRHLQGVSTFKIIDNNILSLDINANTVGYNSITSDSDAINPDHLLYRYKAASNVLGGEGPNISYEFVSVAIAGDVANNSSSNFDFASNSINYLNGIRTTTHNFAKFDLLKDLNVKSANLLGVDVLQEYPLSLPQISSEDMKYPQYNSLYWGYQQNEIYRFGIQFYDKSKNPYFVKWIGDIKFPDIIDHVEPGNTFYEDWNLTGQTTFVKSFVVATSVKTIAYVCQLGLKLSVTIPANLTEQISGYSIVRVKREENDKTVIAEGIITSVSSVIAAEPNVYRPANPLSGGIQTPFLDTYNESIEPNVCYFNTPSILDTLMVQPRPTDKLNIRSTFNKTQTAGGSWTNLGNGAATDAYFIYKLYNDTQQTSQLNLTIEDVQLMYIGGTTITNGYNVYNADDGGHSLGNTCYMIRVNVGALGIQNAGNSTWKLYATIDRTLTNQYGGNTYGSRAGNEYILCSHFRPLKLSNTTIVDIPQIFGGDTMVSFTDMQRCIKKWTGGTSPLSSTTFIFPAGACLNAGLRYGTYVNKNLFLDDGNLSSGTETYDYNNVYSAQNDIVKFFPKPDPFIINDEYVNRFLISEVKINGELSDSWSSFKPLNYWDVESSYGPINACDVLMDQVYYVQDRAFGILLINPRTAITGTDGEVIQLGKGDIIDRHKYISTETGSKHQFSFLKSANNIFFIDIRHKKMYAFSPGQSLTPETDLKGLHGFLQRILINKLETTDKPVYVADDGHNGIHGIYDYTNSELIYTIFEKKDKRSIENKYTIVYNDNLKFFTSDNYSHYPKQYITNHRKFLSPNPQNSGTYKDLYLHNYGNYGEFYGTLFDSTVEFLSNKYPEITKVFTNLTWESELQDGTTFVDLASGATPVQETFTKLDVSTDYQSNGVVFNYLTNLRRRFRTWYTEVPRSSVNAEYMSAGFFSKMRDKYLRVKMSYSNHSNYRILIHKVLTMFGINQPK